MATKTLVLIFEYKLEIANDIEKSNYGSIPDKAALEEKTMAKSLGCSELLSARFFRIMLIKRVLTGIFLVFIFGLSISVRCQLG